MGRIETAGVKPVGYGSGLRFGVSRPELQTAFDMNGYSQKQKIPLIWGLRTSLLWFACNVQFEEFGKVPMNLGKLQFYH
jgi:hypothetical protein